MLVVVGGDSLVLVSARSGVPADATVVCCVYCDKARHFMPQRLVH